jgi:hypothetical protein
MIGNVIDMPDVKPAPGLDCCRMEGTRMNMVNVPRRDGIRLAVTGTLCVLVAGCTGAATNLAAAPTALMASRQPAPRTSPTPGKAIPTATLLAEAGKAWATVKSVHITGTFVGAGPSPHWVVQPAGTPAVLQTYDMRVATVGSGNTESFIGEGRVRGPGFAIDVIHIDNKTYLRGDAAYYRLLGPKAVAVTGHWLVDTFIEFPEPTVSSPQGTAVYPESTLLPSISSQMQLIPNPPLYGVSVTRGPQRLWDGKSVIPLHFSGNGFPPADLYLAATGTPYQVRAVTTEANIGWSETANYSQYNVPFTVKAPVGAIDIHSVQQDS